VSRIGIASLAGALLALAVAASAQSVTINEIRIDEPGTDNSEYFELYGPGGTPLTGLTYVVIGDGAAGTSGVIECVVDLTAQVIPADGFFVASEGTFDTAKFGFVADLVLSGNGLNFENSDNVTHMLVSGFTGAVNDDLDADDDGVLDTTPWASIEDWISVVEEPGGGEHYYSPVVVGPDRIYMPGHVYRAPDGTGSWNIGLFDIAVGVDTPGGPNAVAMHKVSGTVTFSMLHPSAVPPSVVVMRVVRDGNPLTDLNVGPDETGYYEVYLPPDIYTLSIKHTHWLRRTVAADVTNGDVSDVDFVLVNGDADESNAVDLGDLNVILIGFGTAGPTGDVNEDGSVALEDLNIVLVNFGQIGDE
jgi:hypothetical protein